jgi:hypothetical protein
MPDLLNTTSGAGGGGFTGYNYTQPAQGIFTGQNNILPATNPMEFFLRGVPGYEFAFGQGQRAVQTSAAARGTLLTGGTLRELARYGTGIADQLYGNTVNRYMSLADLGLRGATAPFV